MTSQSKKFKAKNKESVSLWNSVCLSVCVSAYMCGMCLCSHTCSYGG